MVEEMKKSIECGVTVLIDRYAFSGVAFSAAKVCIFLGAKLLCEVVCPSLTFNSITYFFFISFQIFKGFF